jgi:hypothetical protein
MLYAIGPGRSRVMFVTRENRFLDRNNKISLNGGGYMCEAGCTRWDMPDSLVPRTVRFTPNPRIFGNRLVGVSSVGAPLRV